MTDRESGPREDRQPGELGQFLADWAKPHVSLPGDEGVHLDAAMGMVWLHADWRRLTRSMTVCRSAQAPGFIRGVSAS